VDQIVLLLQIGLYVALANNFVLGQFLGLCPFIGVTKKTSSAFGMGVAVTFVMTMASVVTYCIYEYLLVPYGLVDVLATGSFILVIAALVQLVEMVIRKTSPGLYQALGIYLPLITTNCAVLGVALLNTTKAPMHYTLLEATAQGFFGGAGFMIAMLLMSGVRESLEHSNVPKALRGAPIAFICTSIMALAFMGFSGIVTLGK